MSEVGLAIWSISNVASSPCTSLGRFEVVILEYRTSATKHGSLTNCSSEEGAHSTIRSG